MGSYPLAWSYLQVCGETPVLKALAFSSTLKTEESFLKNEISFLKERRMILRFNNVILSCALMLLWLQSP